MSFEAQNAAGAPPVTTAAGRYGNDGLYAQMHEDALMLIESLGMQASPAAARKIMAALDPGEASRMAYSEDQGRLYVTRETVDICLDRIRQAMDFWPRGFGTGGMAAYVVEGGQPRPASLDDLRQLTRIFGRTDEITSLQASFNVCNRIKKADVDGLADMECAIIDIMAELGGGKLITPTIRSDRGIDHLAELHRRGHPVGGAVSITSTFMAISEEMVGPFLRLAQQGVAFIMNSMPIGGLTGPYGMTALATLAHAEALFGLVLGQLVCPGVKGVHAAMPTIADMGRKDMPLRFGSRANTLLNILLAELCGWLEIPGCQSACSHSRDLLDADAIRESAETYTLVNQYHYHIIRHMFGFASQLNDFCLENMEREIALYREATAHPVTVQPVVPAEYDPDGFEALLEGISGQDFRNLNHTLKNIGRAFSD